jgi:raffinose/stachyose/melibiose transport system permease protein
VNTATRRQIVVNYALLILFSFMALFPVFGVFLASVYPSGSHPSSFVPPPHFDFGNFATAWTQGHFSQYFRSSAIVAISTVVASTVLSILGGYAFGTIRFRGSKVLFYTFILGLIIPTEATIVALYYDIRALNLIDTYTALILIEVSGEVAFGVFWMRAAFMSAPRSLLEAARIDGASTWRLLWRIMVPFAWPAILIFMVLTFADSWDEFFLALVFTTSESHLTAPAGLQVFSGRYLTNIPLVAAGAVIVSVPIMLVFIIFQRQFIRGVLTGAVKQ